ncbi:MAG: hypothetical protein AB1705_04260 [Verrucomicrobiota bacterium]
MDSTSSGKLKLQNPDFEGADRKMEGQKNGGESTELRKGVFSIQSQPSSPPTLNHQSTEWGKRQGGREMCGKKWGRGWQNYGGVEVGWAEELKLDEPFGAVVAGGALRLGVATAAVRNRTAPVSQTRRSAWLGTVTNGTVEGRPRKAQGGTQSTECLAAEWGRQGGRKIAGRKMVEDVWQNHVGQIASLSLMLKRFIVRRHEKDEVRYSSRQAKLDLAKYPGPTRDYMNAKVPVLPVESGLRKRPAIRLWFLLVVLSLSAFIAWFVWPSDAGVSVTELSRADGKPRFKATSYGKADLSGQSLRQRLSWYWRDYSQRAKPNPAAYSFPARPVQRCLIDGLLSQCMEISGTKYLISVEILGGTIEFGYTNTLNGVQWVSSFEDAITNQVVLCYDYAAKRRFRDRLILVHEEMSLVKVVPRSKLSEYEKAGLVKAKSADHSKK